MIQAPLAPLGGAFGLPGALAALDHVRHCSFRALGARGHHPGGSSSSGQQQQGQQAQAPTSPVCRGEGNVYPKLSEAAVSAMRARRLASNCAPDQLAHIADVAHEHQRKHIMLCSGSHSRSDCQANCSEHHGTRCWEYLSQRLAEINQLRAEDDEQEPILVSRLQCLQAQNLLPPLATTLPCHGPIAVVWPGGWLC